MNTLRLERDFKTTPERLFAAISQQGDLLRWWGPEGLHIPDGALDFTRTGPWYSVMQNDEGQRFKVSGQVTHVDAPNSIGFTWAWHDDQDRRGRESHVSMIVEVTRGGSRLILEHINLDDSDQSARHEAGWASSLRKLAALLK